MTAIISFHGPYTYHPRAYRAGQAGYHDEPYASLRIGDDRGNDVTLYLGGDAECDELIRAATETKNLRAAAAQPPGDGAA